jgi:hypothetical protein
MARIGLGRGAAVAGACLALLVAADANASPFELYGAGARGAALGNAMTAEASGADAVFYNVAGLARAIPGVSIGFMVGTDNARILLNDRPGGYEIPDFGSSTPTVPSDATLQERRDSDAMGTFGTVTLGAVTGLGSPRLRLGFLMSAPAFGVDGSSTRFSDERERLFSNALAYELIGSRVRRLDIEAGVAYRVLDNLSIGLGMTLQPKASTVNGVYLENATDQSQVDINLSQSSGFSAGFTAGALLELSDWMRLGLSFRQGIGFDIDGENTIQIRGLSEEDVDEYPIRQQLAWRPQSSPTMATAGAATDLGKSTVLFDMRYTVWSGYRDSQGEKAGFDNTISPRLGLEYHYNDRTTARVGLSFDPTPVPDQVGRTNYVDNDRGAISVGASHNFEVRERSLSLSWFLQGQLLIQRQTSKASAVGYPVCAEGVTVLCDEVADNLRDARTGQPLPGAVGLQTENPGFPGFSSGGWLGAIGLELTWHL